MRRLPTYLPSLRPYAVDLTSLQVKDTGLKSHDVAISQATVQAVWFRRRRKTLVAVYGQLRTYQTPGPADATEFLTRYTDGRYGGDAWLRWDGDNLWNGGTHLTYDEANDLWRTLLAPMLANHPDLPSGYDGWWTFQKETR